MNRGWRGYERRPPWWPESEPFPPRRGMWAADRHRFYRRMFFLFVAVMGLVVFGAFALFWTIASALGFRPEGGPPPWWIDRPGGPPFFVFPLVIVVAVLLLGRTFLAHLPGRATDRLLAPRLLADLGDRPRPEPPRRPGRQDGQGDG